MITGAHAIIYSHDAEADRKFLKDVLGLRSVDAGGGWLIFGLPPSEVAVHPDEAGKPGHELYLLCDDIDATVEDLKTKGVTVEDQLYDERWGLLAFIRLPGGGKLGIYQPRHPRAPHWSASKTLTSGPGGPA
jgi:catechol 2,3-dioxygenase-like lactoylglutathione lyase family enzyme